MSTPKPAPIASLGEAIDRLLEMDDNHSLGLRYPHPMATVEEIDEFREIVDYFREYRDSERT